MPTSANKKEFILKSSHQLTDYVTVVTWSPCGERLAATSSAGEVILWENGDILSLQLVTDTSIDCAAFSADGQFLATGGQDGQVKIWRGQELIATLANAPAWVDKLAWSPTTNHLAFSIGTYVQIWDANQQQVVTTLNFADSSPLGIGWRCDGKYLAVGGNRGIKVWESAAWDDGAFELEMPTVSLTLAWSGDGKFLASGNMDRTISVYESELIPTSDPQPWIMRGFPGKIRSCCWSDISTPIGAPLLATSSVEGVVVWEKSPDESIGWEARVLTNHVDVIQAIGFAPQSFLLASAANDGWLCLWNEAKQVSQVLTGAEKGFASLAWHPQGKLLAAGGDRGEVLIWSQSSRAQGFGK